MMNLQQIIDTVRAERNVTAVAYEGNEVEYEGEHWYELAVWEGEKLSYEWYAELEGDAVYYDQAHLSAEDRISEIDEAIAKRG